MTLEFHPLANVLPLLEGAEFDRLVADIAEHGLHNPITVYDGKILDGRNRAPATLRASSLAMSNSTVTIRRPSCFPRISPGGTWGRASALWSPPAWRI